VAGGMNDEQGPSGTEGAWPGSVRDVQGRRRRVSRSETGAIAQPGAARARRATPRSRRSTVPVAHDGPEGDDDFAEGAPRKWSPSAALAPPGTVPVAAC